MKIKYLHLENYRCFKTIDINFDDHLTVLTGLNGSGKTAVLEAMEKILQFINSSFTNNIFDIEFKSSDISIKNKNEKILMSFILDHEDASPNLNDSSTLEESIELTFRKSNKLSNILKPIPSDLVKLANLSDSLKTKYLKKNAKEIPICTSYRSGRVICDEDTKLSSETSNGNKSFQAFTNAFNRQIDYASTLSWFNDIDAYEARQIRDRGNIKFELPELKAMREAISKVLIGYYEKPQMRGFPPELVIFKKGSELSYKIDQLSDGHKDMLALTMDLTRRMALANGGSYPKTKSLLHSPAIVLIDEVELHLHPQWQQIILPILSEKIFPNTQFIVTTHSPQVISSIWSKNIRVLLEDKQPYKPTEETKGAEASRVMSHIFNVNPRPACEIVDKLNRYSQLVYEESWETEEAVTLCQQLVEHFGKDDPELFKLAMHIDEIKSKRKN